MAQDFSRFLEQFDAVEEDPAGYLVSCPAHDDRSPSLLLTLKEDGRLLVFCRAGCPQDAVLRELGLSPRELFHWVPGSKAVAVRGGREAACPTTGQVAALRMWLDATTARWDNPEYLDLVDIGETYLRDRFGIDIPTMERLGLGLSPRGAEDRFAYLSPRFRRYPRLVVPMNDFTGVARGAQGRDLSGDCTARWVSLATRRSQDDPEPVAWAKYGVLPGGADFGVYVITEGPSDGLAVAAVGYDAVFVRGASLANSPSLADELADGLRGHPVVIMGDNDKAGRKFTTTLGKALRERGISATWGRIPHDGYDVADWRKEDPEGFADALHKAVREAAPIPEDDTLQGRVVVKAGRADAVTRDDGQRAAKIIDDLAQTYGESDVMRAHALVEYCGGRIKYAPGLGFWSWNGRIWEPGEHRIRQAVHAMGAALMVAGRGREAAWFGTTRLIDALITELRAVPSVAVNAQAFDARPELLTFRNGTVNLCTGELREPDMRDMLTRFVDYDYDPKALAPRWERFLREIFPDHPEMPDYMRRLIGYGITGDTSEQCFAVLWGKGANGKSVFTETLSHVFRDIARTTPFQTFEEKPNGGIPNDLAALRGARLVMASEGESGKPMAEAVLKRVTGTDRVSARFLRQEFFEFKPAFLLLLATNHKPRFRGQDDGLWRRVKLIGFNRFFRPEERDHTLAATLRSEAPGIIAWAVRGAKEWYDTGLQDPAVVKDATKEYRETSDPLAGFIPDILEIDGESEVLGAEAYNRYLDWWNAENLQGKPWSRPGFYSAMEERGAVKHKKNTGIHLQGVRLVGASANTSATGGSNSNEGSRIFEN